jgi:hypothetical protein
MIPIDPIDAISELRSLGCNYFVDAFGKIKCDDTVDVFHVVGYPAPPSDVDFSSLIVELSQDEELLMTHLEYKKDYILMIFDESYFVT